MRKFAFSLEKVLDYRASKEEQLKIQLTAVQAERQTEEHVLEQCRLELVQQTQEAPSGSINLSRWLHRWTYLERLEEARTRQQARVEEAQRVEKNCQRGVVAAMQERKVLEELKAREVKAHMAESSRQEQATMDEVAVTAFARKQDKHYD
ncbi:MAG: flagellar export protein FliJ [Bacillota bacterium]